MKINNINSYTTPHMTKSSGSKDERKDKGYSLSLSVNGQSDQITVKVLESKSKDIVKEATVDELRDIHDKIYDMAGRLFGKKP